MSSCVYLKTEEQNESKCNVFATVHVMGKPCSSTRLIILSAEIDFEALRGPCDSVQL